MRNLVVWLSLLGFAFTPAYALPQTSGDIALTSPQPGAVLQGSVTVTGSIDAPDLAAWELLFAYAEDLPGGNPFLLAQGNQPVRADTLTVWDTTLIPDGNYRLFVRVKLADGRVEDFIVDGLRVRNYSPVETATPQAQQATLLPADTATPQPSATVLASTPTAYQPNPGSIRHEEVVESMLRGIGFTVIALLMIGIYTSIRRRDRRS